ncbi:ribonuclease E inhibitor RraB [Flavobacterium ustbae]|uniref:ribonuclease E inhibitor RraB n=1 Tax=Flavobacterium ustbae TaxID=2488790 RepID=UPI000F789C8E|nr:ribonuclease E inhibitor RraB [Flavobacterium ustbae]
MEILSFFKNKQKKQFVSETDFIINQGTQFRAAIESLVTLRDAAVEEEDELKIDYFFYTNTLEKAQNLEKEIQKKHYIVNHAIASHDKQLFVISGRTTAIKMMHETLSKWAGEMCELGYQYDCSFENWKIVPAAK